MKNNALRLGDPSVHFWLTRSVARAMGVNLSEAMAAGRLSVQDYAALVTRCRQCPYVADCTAWLATEAVPQCRAMEGCANSADLARLQ